MVSRIEVIPSEVRGYGNIVKKKDIDDFVTFNSDISLEEDIFTLSFDDSPLIVSIVDVINNSSNELLVNDIVYLTIRLLTSTNKRVTNANADIYMNDTLLSTKSSNATGTIEFTYEFTNIGTFEFKAVSNNIESNTITITVSRQNSNISVED
jgi:hypothetical protein